MEERKEEQFPYLLGPDESSSESLALMTIRLRCSLSREGMSGLGHREICERLKYYLGKIAHAA